MLRLIFSTALLALQACAQMSPSPTNGVAASQTSAFSAAFSSYIASYTHASDFHNLEVGLFLQLPGDVVASLRQNPQALIPITGSFDLQSLATAPPTTFSTATWETNLSSDVEASVKGAQTSVALAAATIAQSVVGVSTSLPTPAPASSTGGAAAAARPTAVAGAVGLAGFAAGAAAALL